MTTFLRTSDQIVRLDAISRYFTHSKPQTLVAEVGNKWVPIDITLDELQAKLEEAEQSGKAVTIIDCRKLVDGGIYSLETIDSKKLKDLYRWNATQNEFVSEVGPNKLKIVLKPIELKSWKLLRAQPTGSAIITKVETIVTEEEQEAKDGDGEPTDE